ncbi:MAG TPA: hypothetical protein VLI04_03215 [Nocardioidaceae bacterium]|nr:hypothetical protein [Nocardioidaceae bacterium]
MTSPRVVVVHRRSEYNELIRRHGTRGQAEFFLGTRGRSIAAVAQAHAVLDDALAAVHAAIPRDWRRGSVERAELARFPFEPDDRVVVVGQDGLVANVAKYLDGQPVLGVDPGVSGNLGVLTRHALGEVPALLPALGSVPTEARTMVEARIDDGQTLAALNEVYVGHASHQTARYRLDTGAGSERQASSGLIVATGTGASGWCRSAWLERHSLLELPRPTDPSLGFFVREAWPSSATGTTYTEGLLEPGCALTVTVESDRLVIFGDGLEADCLVATWGQTITVARAGRLLSLV